MRLILPERGGYPVPRLRFGRCWDGVASEISFRPIARTAAVPVVCVKLCKWLSWQRPVFASGSEPRDVFLLLLQKLHIEIAVIFEPALVGLRTQGADES